MSALSLISVGSWIGSKVANKGFDALSERILSDKTLNAKFYKAVELVSKELQQKYPDLLGDDIYYFFKREEVFNELFKLLFKSSTVNQEKIGEHFDTNTLPVNFIAEFLSLLQEELLKDRMFDEIFSNNQLYIIFQGLSIGVNEIAQNSNITSSEIVKLNRLLEEQIGSAFDFSTFIEVYTKNAINNLSQVNFIGLGIDISIKKNRKYLQDIFVRPLFELANFKHSKSKKRNSKYAEKLVIDYKTLLSVNDRIVILGNPGAGKSVLIKSLICDILEKKVGQFKNKSACENIPFRIELRNYLSFKKEHKGTLLKYLIFTLEHEYQISNITEPILNKILTEKPCLIFFDGLDEIFDLSDKINVKNDIENFHNLYPKIKSIVTSRIIGYEEAYLNDKFTELNILNFNDNQINAYVKQWYSKEEEIDEVRNREISGFLNKKHEIDNELITNPLLLSLIVILYRNILKLPESKLEIYQSCTKTLVDKWDASKDLKIDLDDDIYKAKDKLFADLAYWQYRELSSKTNSITYNKAKSNVSGSLIKLEIGNEYNSDELAEKFMTYAQKRSIYFENNFTHKTFLEYYTAYWIYSNIEKKHRVEERNNLIFKYVANPFWFIVFELLFNLIDKDQADNDIIDELFETLLDANSNSLQFLLSVSFKLKNISQKIIDKTILDAILFLVNKTENKDKTIKIDGVYSRLKALCNPNEYPYTVVINQFNIAEKLLLNNTAELTRLYILYGELNLATRNGKLKFEFSNINAFKACCELDEYLSRLNYHFGDSKESDFEKFITNINRFGIQYLYKEHRSLFDGFYFGEFINFLPYLFMNDAKKISISEMLEVFEEYGLSKKVIYDKLTNNSGYHFNEEDILKIINKLALNRDIESIKILSLILLSTKSTFNEFSDSRKSFTEILRNYRELEEISLILSNKSQKEKINIIMNK